MRKENKLQTAVVCLNGLSARQISADPHSIKLVNPLKRFIQTFFFFFSQYCS